MQWLGKWSRSVVFDFDFDLICVRLRNFILKSGAESGQIAENVLRKGL